MGEMMKLTAKDGVVIGAYCAKPTGAPKGGIVVIQEIFGVNHHIRAMADLYASHGYYAVAPALYDRVQRDYESGYEPADMQSGMAVRAKTEMPKTLLDIEAAIAEAAKGGKVGVVGWCWGGTLSFAAACKTAGISAASCYYGGGVVNLAGDKPQCPTIMHFGETDHSIPASDIETFKSLRPEIPVYVYPAAGHGFNCDERGAFQEAARDLARQRTLDLFAKNL